MMVYTASPFVGPEVGPLIGGVSTYCVPILNYTDIVSAISSSLLRILRGAGKCSLDHTPRRISIVQLQMQI